MAEREELPARGRLAVEPALRQQPVDDDDRRVREREPVGPERERQRARADQRDGERAQQQHVLPGGDDVERGAAHADASQSSRHDEVVEREPDDEDDERDPGEALAHVIATSVMPRLTIRTGPGKSARRSPLPSRWFSLAQPLPARS